jgi:hypothetical protein
MRESLGNCKPTDEISMSETDAAYTRIFLTLTRRYSDTQTFRRLVSAGEPLASAHASAEDATLVRAILTDPEFDRFFLDREKAVEFFGGPEALRASFTQNKISTLRRIVDIASIVLVHSALDAAITDLCRLTALLGPSDWEPLLERQQVPLADARSEPYAALLKAKLAAHLDALERDSLLKRSDVLFTVCRPPVHYTPLNGYSWDREELERLDQLRHDLVHGRSDVQTLPHVEKNIEFLLKTGLFFWSMLNTTYSVKLDPLWMVQPQPK